MALKWVWKCYAKNRLFRIHRRRRRGDEEAKEREREYERWRKWWGYKMIAEKSNSKRAINIGLKNEKQDIMPWLRQNPTNAWYWCYNASVHSIHLSTARLLLLLLMLMLILKHIFSFFLSHKKALDSFCCCCFILFFLTRSVLSAFHVILLLSVLFNTQMDFLFWSKIHKVCVTRNRADFFPLFSPVCVREDFHVLSLDNNVQIKRIKSKPNQREKETWWKRSTFSIR